MSSRPAWLRTLLRFWDRARAEHCAPHQVGLAVAAGAFSACSPLLGLHMWIAIFLATIFRLNRLWAFAGSRISFGPLFALIAFSEIQAAHRLRMGEWASLSRDAIVAEGKTLLVDWFVGMFLVGPFIAALLGLVAYASARRWQGRAQAAAPPAAPTA